jgi:serine/threonine-protein kinase HipA
MLQARRDEDRSYAELADAIRAHRADPKTDFAELWRRLVFNLLIGNVDDHLRNTDFLHVGAGLWRLAPAFDLNPYPDKAREPKTWLSKREGPITSTGSAATLHEVPPRRG